MFKNIFSKASIVTSITIGLFLFFGCKKDPQTNPPIIVQPIVTTPAPPVKIEDSIYPNPCHGTFTIKTNSTDSQKVVMCDVTGKTILNLVINGTTAVVDNGLVNGVYFLIITNKTGVIKEKLIVIN